MNLVFQKVLTSDVSRFKGTVCVTQLSSPEAGVSSIEPRGTLMAAGGSCLGPELLSQLAALGINTAQLERDHPAPQAAEHVIQVACFVRLPSSLYAFTCTLLKASMATFNL